MQSLAVVAVAVCVGITSACSGSSFEGGDNGSGGSGGSGPGPTNGSTATSSSSHATTSSASGGAPTCDAIGVCQDPGGLDMNYDNDCLSCTIAGMFHSDGGACQMDYLACFGTGTDCSGGNVECCSLGACVAACPTGELACICTTTDGKSCDMTQTDPKTCFGKFPNAVSQYSELLGCMYSKCTRSCPLGT